MISNLPDAERVAELLHRYVPLTGFAAGPGASIRYSDDGRSFSYLDPMTVVEYWDEIKPDDNGGQITDPVEAKVHGATLDSKLWYTVTAEDPGFIGVPLEDWAELVDHLVAIRWGIPS